MTPKERVVVCYLGVALLSAWIGIDTDDKRTKKLAAMYVIAHIISAAITYFF